MDPHDIPPPGPPERPPLSAVSRRLAQTAAVAVAVCVGVMALLAFPRPRPALPPAQVAAAAPVALPATESPAPAAVPTPPALRPRIAPASPPKRPAVAVAREVRRRAPARPVIVVMARRPAGPCRAPSLAADRLVCSQPSLAAQDRRMRGAYERALAAGADRLDIDRGQARWRGARDRATDERRLAELYSQRIAALEAAARNPRRPRLFGG